MQLRTIKFPGLPDAYTVTDTLEDSANPGCYYRIVNGQVQWCNPPMAGNTEYRLADRHMGHPVYGMLLDFGNMPNNSYKELTMGVGDLTVIDVQGICESAGQVYEFPVVNNSGEAVAWYYTRNGAAGDFIQLWTRGDYSSARAHFFIRYIKEG